MFEIEDNPRCETLVVGVGNILLRDDGVGVHAVQALATLILPSNIQTYDAGTRVLDAARVMEGRSRVFILDAIQAGLPAGSILRMETQALRSAESGGMSLHSVHLLDALQETAMLRCATRDVTVLAVQVKDVSAGLELTLPVAAALPRLCRHVLDELGLQDTPTPAAVSVVF